jgi:hypothetical protein
MARARRYRLMTTPVEEVVLSAQRWLYPPPPLDPVSIPHDYENRGEATRIDGELNPHVIGPIPPAPQVTEPPRLNLSRWRHGFEPRWDYQRKAPGQPPSSARHQRRNGHLQARLIPRISRGRTELAVRAVDLVMPDRACHLVSYPTSPETRSHEDMSPPARGGDTGSNPIGSVGVPGLGQSGV